MAAGAARSPLVRAQTTPGLEDAAPFRIERVSEHVYAGIALTAPVVNGNSAFIVTKRGLVVVDAQSRPSAARSLYQRFRREVADLPVRFLIDTHHHMDHAHGNAAYAELARPPFDIVSTTFARAALEQGGRWLQGFLAERPLPAEQLEGVPNQERYYAFLDGYLGGLRRELAAAPPGEPHDPHGRLAALRSFFEEVSRLSLALPTLTFDHEMVLHCGDVEVRLLHLGRAHTAGDAVVLVPQDRVVLTGDVAHGIDPLFFEAYPDEWAQTLERLAALDFDLLVPAHGPVQRGRETLQQFTAYVRELTGLVRDGIAAGRDLAALQKELTPARFGSLQADGFGAALQRNREELLGLPPGQPLEPVVAYGVEQVYRHYAPDRR